MTNLQSNLQNALSRLSKSAKVDNGAPPHQSIPFPVNASTYAGIKYDQSNTIYTQHQFYSPLHTPQNWQIPQKRREVYNWLRYFAENEPKVAAALNFYSHFSINGFETQCNDNKIKKFYDNLNQKL